MKFRGQHTLCLMMINEQFLEEKIKKKNRFMMIDEHFVEEKNKKKSPNDD